MKSDLAKCKHCRHLAESGWMMMDARWSSFYVGCSNDLCDAMISMEVVSEGSDLGGVEQAVKQAWNQVNG